MVDYWEGKEIFWSSLSFCIDWRLGRGFGGDLGRDVEWVV